MRSRRDRDGTARALHWLCMQDLVVAHAREVVAIAETEALLAAGGADTIFTAEERRYAESKSDPARRLAARWAAKRAAIAALGDPLSPLEIEVRRGLFMEEKTRRPHRAMARLQEVIRELLLDIGRFMAERLTPAPASQGWLRTAS